MTAVVQGLEPFQKYLASVDRRLTKERQKLIAAAAKQALVPEMRQRAGRSPGKAGPLLARFTVARLGKNGAVLVGPKGGKKAAWYRAFFIAGSRPHLVGAAVAARPAGVRTYLSGAVRRVKARDAVRRRFMTNARSFQTAGGSPFQALGPVSIPALPGNPFVSEGAEAGSQALCDALAKSLYGREA